MENEQMLGTGANISRLTASCKMQPGFYSDDIECIDAPQFVPGGSTKVSDKGNSFPCWSVRTFV